jgi:hypothetical protein
VLGPRVLWPARRLPARPTTDGPDGAPRHAVAANWSRRREPASLGSWNDRVRAATAPCLLQAWPGDADRADLLIPSSSGGRRVARSEGRHGHRRAGLRAQPLLAARSAPGQRIKRIRVAPAPVSLRREPALHSLPNLSINASSDPATASVCRRLGDDGRSLNRVFSTQSSEPQKTGTRSAICSC